MSIALDFDCVTPSNLSEWDVWKIFDIEQDMWARKEGLWEYLECRDCCKIFSKQDIYDKKDKSTYNFTVSEIEKKSERKTFVCPCCEGELKHCFQREYWIEEIKIRYSQRSHLVLMKAWAEIVGFMDGYVASYDDIYEREFSDHYSRIWKNTIAEKIRQVLQWNMPDEFFSCSSMWTKEQYMWLLNSYKLLQCFFSTFPAEYDGICWISELNEEWTLDRIYTSLWSRSLDLSRLKWDVNCSVTYNSTISLQENIWYHYRRAFLNDLRTFLRERAI